MPEFELKTIDIEKLRKIMKRTNGRRGHGHDFIDSYSLNLAFPHIEDVLLHLVNLSLRNHKFAKAWKIQLIHPLALLKIFLYFLNQSLLLKNISY